MGTSSEPTTPTLEERVAFLEKAWQDAIVNPPKLPDAAALDIRIKEAKGQAESALRQVGALSDTIVDRVDAAIARVDAFDNRLTAVEQAEGIAPPAPRDFAHERCRVKRTFECVGCGAQSNDDVSKASVAATAGYSQHKTCPLCGNATKLIGVEHYDPSPEPTPAAA